MSWLLLNSGLGTRRRENVTHAESTFTDFESTAKHTPAPGTQSNCDCFYHITSAHFNHPIAGQKTTERNVRAEHHPHKAVSDRFRTTAAGLPSALRAQEAQLTSGKHPFILTYFVKIGIACAFSAAYVISRCRCQRAEYRA